MEPGRPLEYLFTESHEWIRPQASEGDVGITDFAQEELGDIVFVDPGRVGTAVVRGEPFADVESVKFGADLFSPVTGTITAVNPQLIEHPEVVNHDPYGTGWIARIRIADPGELGSLRNVLEYRAEVLGEIEHVFMLDEANRIHYIPAVRAEDGRLIVKTEDLNSVLVRSLVPFDKLRKLQVAEEFEELINRPRLREQDLQRFFEQHPEFLLGTEYDRLYPQVTLPVGDQAFRPDFILQPLAGVSYGPNIVELKLPSDRIVNPVPRQEGFYANVYKAVMQLRGYARFFQETEHREYLREKLGFTAFKPRLTLIIGKKVELGDEKVVADILEALRPVELVTYKDVLLRYRRLVEQG